MGIKTVEENKYILRRYIRLLGQYKGMKDHKDAIHYFIILHNFLVIEDLFYDQCLMANKQINAHLNLMKDVRFCATAVQYYKLLYDPNHKVRFGIETLDSIEDVRVFLSSDACKKADIYNKLLIEHKNCKTK